MGGGKAGGAGTVAAAGIYTGGRVATNALTVAQTVALALAQIGAAKWMIDRQESMWDHVAAKQIFCVETALDEFIRAVDSLLPTFKDAYPDVPEAARYVAVSPQEEQFNQMVANITNGPKTEEYLRAANHSHRLNYMARVELLSPGFTANLSKCMRQVDQLLDGTLPIDEMVAINSDEAELAAMLGRGGNYRMQSNASLGIRRLQIQQLGRDEMDRRLKWMQEISPVGSEVNMNDLMVSPERRLLFALEQAQLIQNDLQNFNNMKAQKHPAKMAELQAKLQRTIAVLTFSANKANMLNQFVPNFQAIFAPAVSNLMQAAVAAMASNEKSPASGQDLGGHLTPAGPGSNSII